MPRASSNFLKGDTSQRFVFLDLDSLLSSVRAHVLSHESQFHSELALFSSEVSLSPEHLTVLLNDQQPAKVQCWRGTYCANPNAMEAKALQAVRNDGGFIINWQLTQKGTPQHPTLEKMLKRHLTKTKTIGVEKTLILATGALTNSIRNCVDAYLAAHWHVQLVTLQSCYKKSNWQLPESDTFNVKCIDKYLNKLLTGRHGGRATCDQRKVNNMSPTRRPEQRFSSNNSNCTSPAKPVFESSPLQQEFCHEKKVAMLKQEIDDIQRRQAKLASLPSGKYAVGSRHRHVFMNLDNIAGAVCNSQWLYQRVKGATSGYDVRLNFRALTERVCGTQPTFVKRRLAVYRKMPRELALPLQEFTWEVNALSQSSSGNKGLYYVLLDLLETAGSAKHKNTLVLVMGDGALGGSGMEQKEATKDLLTKFLEKNWFVEIHSWLHALSDWFLDVQEQYQYRVIVKPLDDAINGLVFLKQGEEDALVKPEWPASQQGATDAVCASSPLPPPLNSTVCMEQRMKLEDERKDLLERLRKNQEAMDALELETWSMQVLQQQELTRMAQQASEKHLAIRMAEEGEIQLKLLQEYEKSQEEELWNWTCGH
ncbi:unnamed protein product [Peronospora belbahrii]|uniref:NYN domain-containing protein n=1 Tax=Peronospora belbahrii TaxID=622444 RepID=A0AAU9LS95_9STRA|nr:unnamed protein product [Peronospora belbahrii]